MKKEIIPIEGMENQKDLDRVLASLRGVWGVRQVDINSSSGEAVVSYDENAASLHDFKQAVIDSGFQVRDQHEKNL
jgi:copper chaperone CopZ